MPLALLASAVLWNQEPTVNRDVLAELQRIVELPELEGGITSATVTDLSGQVLFQHRSGDRVVPASNQKLLSSAFALHKLGPDWSPTTKFTVTGSTLHIDSPGDPLLQYEDLVLNLSRYGKKFNKVVLRQAYNPGYPSSWEFDDFPNKYAAAVSAFTVNRGSFELWNENGKLSFRPSSFGIKLVRTKKDGPFKFEYLPLAGQLRYQGTPPQKTERLDTLGLAEPWRAAASVLGRTVAVTEQAAGPGKHASFRGRSVKEMLSECLPPSDNNIAEHLLLLGAQSEPKFRENPYGVARASMKSFLVDTVGWQPEDVVVTDGSGMSRHNLLTTRGIAKLLAWQNRQPSAKIFRSALARPGNGTLRSRLNGITFEGKTGTLNMVSSLSGYLTTETGQEVIVSFVMNHYRVTPSRVREIQDQLVKTSLQFRVPRQSPPEGSQLRLPDAYLPVLGW